MMRALYTAATGMIAQQSNVDNISNNLSNVNTVGYKQEKMEFKSLLYQTIQTRTTSANGEEKPISAQVGLGTRVASNTSIYTQGSLMASENATDFAISGDGFFAVRGADGKTYYTRAGDFVWSVNAGGTLTLCTIGLFQFNNPSGLEKTGTNLLAVTPASGNAMNESTTANLTKSKVLQKYLEGSNVQVADEMVNLIIAQRAYQLNSKAITTSDEMLEQANNLKR